jgi:hypothetical protein
MMSGDELFRQDNGGRSEAAVVDDRSSSKHRSSREKGPSIEVDHYKDRLVRVTDHSTLGYAHLSGQRQRTSADLKAELEAVAELTPVSWNLKPWKPGSLSRDLQIRIQDAESAVEKMQVTIDALSEQVAVLCGEVELTDSDDESEDD